MALLGSSRPLLGPIWSQDGPQNVPKSGPKSDPKNVQKIIQKMTQQFTRNKQILGQQMDPKMGNLGEDRQQSQEAGAFQKALVPKMAQDGLKSPKIAPS